MGDASHDRRDFFRELLRRYVVPVADYVEEHLEPVVSKPRPLFRPPGALPAEMFLETCHRCGHCVDVCPADAIVALQGMDEAVNGTPCIAPERQPCVVCDGLECMAVCPSGALLRLPLEQVQIGLAEVDPEACVRSNGEDCRECITLCPLGDRAIGLDKGGAVKVMLDGCVGCGVCQHVCPTSPKAIVVKPVW